MYKRQGIDISQDALSVAADNGVRLGIEERVEWRQGNYTDALKADEVFDGIVSNPPYKMCIRDRLGTQNYI